MQKWYQKSPAGFIFSVKAPRLITHYKQFNETTDLLHDFYSTIREGLKEKLGAVLFQLPAKIIYSEIFLQRILRNLNSSFNNTVEFRDASWWNEHVFTQLSGYNVNFCGISIKNLPDEIIANASIIYYRFHGIQHLYFSEYSKQEIKNFAERLIKISQNRDTYIYFNNTATMAAIHNAEELEKLLKESVTTPLKV